MRMCDQSLELISDKYEKTVEELEEVKNKDETIHELQDTVAKLKEQYLKECSHFQLEEDEERWFTMQYDDWRCMIEVYMVDAEVDEEF